MTDFEMQIDFMQAMQQVAANKTLKYLPEEIDWIFNKMMDRFIKLKLKPKIDEHGQPTGGFEVSQLDADAIRTLIVSSYDLIPYIDQDGRRYKCFLPPDYSYLLSDWSYTTLLCGTKPSATSETLFVRRLRQDYSGLTAPKYYASIHIQFGDKEVAIPTDLPYGNEYKGYDDKRNISFIRPLISLLGNWYWERFDSFYYPGFYLQTGTSNAVKFNSNIVIDGASFTNAGFDTINVSKHLGTGKYYDNRLSATDNISGMNSTEFIKSSYYSPISELSNGILYVYNDESFIVSSVGISYIRKPRPISLYLNTDCELPEEFHRTIVDMAVEYAKGTLENIQGYQQKAADNDKRVVI